MKLFGIILVALGLLGLAYQGFTYTKREQVAKIGPLEATTEKHEHVSIPPLASGAALVAGIGLLVLGAREQRV
jgi:hypothetical protein